MDRLHLITRLLLGAIFLVMGLNGFFNFININSETVEGQSFVNALAAIEFFWPFEKLLEIISALMLISNRYTPLAVELLAPIICNIMMFHIFLDPVGLPLALLVLSLEAIMINKYWKSHYSHLLKA